MKYQSMINLIAGAGLAFGTSSLMASDERAAWAHDTNTGTFYHTNAPTVEQGSGAPGNLSYDHQDKANGAWAHDPHTGTFYHTNASTVEQGSGVVEDQTDADMSDFSGSWSHDPVTGTFYHTEYL
jgi:hypothetical protein